MKYIRTKDGIFEVYKETENGYNINTKPFLETTKTRCYLNPFISKEKVIKQADTIEELCDEFVRYVAEDKLYNIMRDYELNDLKLLRERLQKTDDKFYGAIWTDKGLQFVARMNNEGVLQLL